MAPIVYRVMRLFFEANRSDGFAPGGGREDRPPGRTNGQRRLGQARRVFGRPERRNFDSEWRRDPESNRALRICNPVHNRFAIAPKVPRCGPPKNWKKGKHAASLFRSLSMRAHSRARINVWSGRRVSNSRPQPWQGCALPTELLPHVSHACLSRCDAPLSHRSSVPRRTSIIGASRKAVQPLSSIGRQGAFWRLHLAGTRRRRRPARVASRFRRRCRRARSCGPRSSPPSPAAPLLPSDGRRN